MADIKLTFRGQEYIIPDSKAFQAGAVVEEIATLYTVLRWFQDPPLNKIARCQGGLLRFAGVKVSDREVHTELVRASAQGADAVVASLNSLVAVLMDGASVEPPLASGETVTAPEKTEAS